MPKESAIACEWKVILELFLQTWKFNSCMNYILCRSFKGLSGCRMGPYTYDWNFKFQCLNLSRPLQLKVNIYMFSWKGEMQ